MWLESFLWLVWHKSYPMVIRGSPFVDLQQVEVKMFESGLNRCRPEVRFFQQITPPPSGGASTLRYFQRDLLDPGDLAVSSDGQLRIQRASNSVGPSGESAPACGHRTECRTQQQVAGWRSYRAGSVRCIEIYCTPIFTLPKSHT